MGLRTARILPGLSPAAAIPARCAPAHAVFSAGIQKKLAKSAEKRNFEKRLRPNYWPPELM
jgi:hypothetical protein